MKKTRYKLSTGANTTATRNLDPVTAAEHQFTQEKSTPAPPSEETLARLNAIAREYPFCAYIKQKNTFML